MISHTPSSDIDNLCEKNKTNVDFPCLTHVDFDNLGSVDKNKVEEAINDMMATFKTTPLEIFNSLPKNIYDRVEQKWQFILTIERQLREAILAQVMPTLDKYMIAKSMDKYKGNFSPKYRALNILKKQVEDVVT